MPVRAGIAIAMGLALCSPPSWAQTSPGLPPIPSVTTQAQTDAIVRERDAFCGPRLDQTPALASYNRLSFCTCMGVQLSAAHTASMTVTQPMLTKMVIDCTGLAHHNTARTAKPPPGGAWVEMAQGERGRPSLGWGEPNSDARLAPFWLTCQPTGKWLLTVELGEGRPGEEGKVWLSKGLRNLLIKGPIQRSENGPAIQTAFTADNLLQWLGQPEDVVLHAADLPVRFPNATLAAPLRKFIADCRRR